MNTIDMPAREATLLKYWAWLYKELNMADSYQVISFYWSADTGPTMIIYTSADNQNRMRGMKNCDPSKKNGWQIQTPYGVIFVRVSKLN